MDKEDVFMTVTAGAHFFAALDIVPVLIMYSIAIDEGKCKVCGECVSACSNNVYQLEDNRLIIAKAGECTGCETCVTVCPNEAITITQMAA